MVIVMRCEERFNARACYVFDSFCMALGVPVRYRDQAPTHGPWILYATKPEKSAAMERCLYVFHHPDAWDGMTQYSDVAAVATLDDVPIVLTGSAENLNRERHVAFDIIANAFYFLSSWEERGGLSRTDSRQLYRQSVFARLGLPQDIVDRYLLYFSERIEALCVHLNRQAWPRRRWPRKSNFALVLSHDVDFLPASFMDTLVQGAKTTLRHLVREQDPGDALKSLSGLIAALVKGRDPYGCVSEMIAIEKSLGVKASYQVAVGHRHPSDVNYYIENDQVRNYLRVIVKEGFDLCLHGSYRSTEEPNWYLEEAVLLAERLGRPLGSRQHFLSFDYDALFAAQEEAGIQYDMSMGFPDEVGPRAGFSYPYFPYCLKEDRPYNVVQISLFLMDVTLRSYKRLKGQAAWKQIEVELQALRDKGGCASVVWHPIVFGGARDPGYDDLFWSIVDYVKGNQGWATDGKSVNDHWRNLASDYAAFTSA